jgi:hypothetical protein
MFSSSCKLSYIGTYGVGLLVRSVGLWSVYTNSDFQCRMQFSVSDATKDRINPMFCEVSERQSHPTSACVNRPLGRQTWGQG